MGLFDDMGGGLPTTPPDPSQVSLLSAPQPGPMQSVPDATMPSQGDPSIMSMLKYAPGALVQRMLSRAGNGAMNTVAPVPPGMGGLFSPDTLGQAQHRGLLDFGLSMLANSHSQGYGQPAPSFGQALQQGVAAGREGTQGQLTGNLQNQMMAMQLAQQLRMMRSRQALAPQLQPQPGEDQGAWLSRMQQAYTSAVGNSDFQTADAIKDVIKTPELNPTLFNLAHPATMQFEDLGGQTLAYNPRTGKTILIPRTAAPVSPLELAKLGLDTSRFSQTQLQDYNTRVNDLTGKYLEETKPIREVTNNLRNIGALTPRALTGDPASQVALIDSYLRTINPGGMARPANIHLAADAKDLADRAVALKQQISGGGPLSPKQVQQFAAAARSVGSQWKSYNDEIGGRYTKWAGQAQVDPSLVLRNLFDGIDLGGGNAPDTSAGGVDRFLNKGDFRGHGTGGSF